MIPPDGGIGLAWSRMLIAMMTAKKPLCPQDALQDVAILKAVLS
jgi:hypothetical protein